MLTFSPVNCKDLKKMIHQLKFCILTKLKSHLQIFTDYLVNITSMPLQGIFPVCLKCALITQLLKKNNLHPLVINNYRLISNLTFLCKIFEKKTY